MKTSLARVALVTAVVLVVLGGCTKKGDGPVQPKPYNEVRLDFYSAQPLAGGFSYELWAKPVDTSLSAAVDWTRLTRFNFNASGGLLDSNGTLVSDKIIRNLPVDLDAIDSLEVTIEQTSQHATTPSQTIYLQGRVPPNLDSAEIAPLKFAVPSVSGADGYFFLGTPTDADTSDDLSGVWFMLSLPPGTPSDSGLLIPPAPAGWMYAGWVFHHGVWLPTGRFRRAVGADLANPYKGPLAAPDFPGEDFLQNAPTGIDFTFPFALTIGDVVEVTLQPDPDPGTGPFGIIALAFQFPSEPVPLSFGQLVNESADTKPSASVAIYRAGTY